METYEKLLRGNSRVKILMGEFGSGKTELAINYALALRDQGADTAIVDIDLVKPYFRTRENSMILQKHGVLLVAPDKNLANADLPILPHELSRILHGTNHEVVMDVGGGESAIVLGQLCKEFEKSTYQAIMVVNTRRPFTRDKEGIIQTLRRIEKASRLKISGLISNTNLADETTCEHVYEGLQIVEAAAAELQLPILWVVAPEWLAEEVKVDYPLFILKPYTQYPWMI
ncbi:MAG: hypothetical protein H6Q66_1817 [Firmicutes bacterium]|nr:hypothetical protein [Bacillota bacterium]